MPRSRPEKRVHGHPYAAGDGKTLPSSMRGAAPDLRGAAGAGQSAPQTPRETNPHKISQRNKQIGFGKNTLGYARYLKEVPRNRRRREHPRTPDPEEQMSKRKFDGLVRAWRRQLHEWDPPEVAASAAAAAAAAEAAPVAAAAPEPVVAAVVMPSPVPAAPAPEAAPEPEPEPAAMQQVSAVADEPVWEPQMEMLEAHDGAISDTEDVVPAETDALACLADDGGGADGAGAESDDDLNPANFNLSDDDLL